MINVNVTKVEKIKCIGHGVILKPETMDNQQHIFRLKSFIIEFENENMFNDYLERE
jgi:hypothetical protein